MKILTRLILGIALLLLGAVGFAYSGLYNVSALSGHSSLTSWLLSTTSSKSIERHARSITVPDLSDETLILTGANDYQAMCMGCHGGPGIQPVAVGKGLNPQPKNLAESAKNMTAAELFWTTKNGVSMTGMPAWGASHEDAEIWPVVAFLTALPGMEPDEFQSLLEQASGMGHHASDADHSHQGAGDHSNEDAMNTTTVEHIHTDDQISEIEPGQSGNDHGAGHPHAPGQDHSDNPRADVEQAPVQAEETEVEDHHDHKH